MTRRLVVDARYRGEHGIARYAREVISRLSMEWESLPGKYRPGSPLDTVAAGRLRLPRDVLLYNPGYTAGLTQCIQLTTVHDLTHLRISDGRASQLNRLYYQYVVRPAIRKTGHVLTVSPTSADELRDWLADDDVVVHDAGNGCSQIFRQEGEPARLGRPYFLFVGGFKAHKNPRPFFEAMRRFPDHLIVVVSSEASSAIRLASEAGVLPRLEVRTNVSDEHLRSLYLGAEALVFPSIWEGFGLPVVEALTTGAKVVYCSGALSVAEICKGTQYPVEDPSSTDEFIAAMELAIQTPFQAPLGLEEYRWESVAARVNEVLSCCLGGDSV